MNETTITFTYTPTGKRASMVDASGTTSYTYNNRDHVLTKDTPEGNPTYTYDAHENLLTILSSQANGASMTYTYDALNRLASAKDNRIAAGRNVGTDGTFTGFSHDYATETRLACRELAVGFFGRPPFRGAREREVSCSRADTNSGAPSGRPVCVEWRSARRSAADSPQLRNSHHSAAVHRFRQRSISSSRPGSRRPQCAAALDHLHIGADSVMPARTGFNSA